MHDDAGERELLDQVQRDAFRYFVDAASPANGLIADNTREDAHSSIAAVGLGLAAWVVGAERGFIARADAVERTLTVLRFLHGAPQGEEPDVTGHRGFFYHFLDMAGGRRAWESELSMVDTALLVAGALTAMLYFGGDAAGEREVRRLTQNLYERIDWRWALGGRATLAHGWKPECGFLQYGWEGYSEAIVLYVLALGSPTHAIPSASYRAWTGTYQWEDLYGIEHLYAAQLFVHQLSHVWIDFRGIRDAFMRRHRADYFENSARATRVQRLYAIRNPDGFRGYGKDAWGITAGDGPGPARRSEGGVDRRFHGYLARGIPFGPDDGTLAPWAVAASLPFAADLVVPALRHVIERHPEVRGRRGMLASFNPTFAGEDGAPWVCPHLYGIDQGPVVLMIENHRSQLLWKLWHGFAPAIAGLRVAGFRGGWLRRAAR